MTRATMIATLENTIVDITTAASRLRVIPLMAPDHLLDEFARHHRRDSIMKVCKSDAIEADDIPILQLPKLAIGGHSHQH